MSSFLWTSGSYRIFLPTSVMFFSLNTWFHRNSMSPSNEARKLLNETVRLKSVIRATVAKGRLNQGIISTALLLPSILIASTEMTSNFAIPAPVIPAGEATAEMILTKSVSQALRRRRLRTRRLLYLSSKPSPLPYTVLTWRIRSMFFIHAI